jgi:outer membrane protein assembly factor BamD
VGAVALAALLVLSGCSTVRGWFGGRPGTLPPAAKLYEEGESALLKGKYGQAREALVRLVERHPDSDLVPQARLLLGESYYREQEYAPAVREFEQFMTLFPGHSAADLGQYRLARSYFDQMPTVERDQGFTEKALGEFRKLIKQYPESRYAPDAIAKIEACRLRLAQKELWIAAYYVRQGKLEAALQRYDAVLKDYARTAVAPQALFEKADALVRLGRTDEATTALRRLVEEHPGNEWSRRARQRHAQLL